MPVDKDISKAEETTLYAGMLFTTEETPKKAADGQQ